MKKFCKSNVINEAIFEPREFVVATFLSIFYILIKVCIDLIFACVVYFYRERLKCFLKLPVLRNTHTFRLFTLTEEGKKVKHRVVANLGSFESLKNNPQLVRIARRLLELTGEKRPETVRSERRCLRRHER